MSNSVVGELFLTNNDTEKQTLSYLKKIGVASDKMKKGYDIRDKHLYSIEFKEKINLLSTLEICGYFEKNKYISICNICEEGISFYLVEQYMGDGFLFVPMSNIIAIHTIDKDNLQGLITQKDWWEDVE